MARWVLNTATSMATAISSEICTIPYNIYRLDMFVNLIISQLLGLFTLQLISAAVIRAICFNKQLTLMRPVMVARPRQPLPPMRMARSLVARLAHLEAAAVPSSRLTWSLRQILKFL